MNKASLDRLMAIGRQADTKKMEELLQVGKADRGMTTFNLGAILSYIEENHDQARAMVALAAGGYALSGCTLACWPRYTSRPTTPIRGMRRTARTSSH